MRIALALPFVALLFSCATPTEIYLPDGSLGYNVNCSGSLMNWGVCAERAGEICGARGYTVLAQQEDGGASVSATQFGAFGSTIHNRTMQITCGQ